MARTPRPRKHRRGDALTMRDTLDSKGRLQAEYTAGPADRLAREMSEKWGIDRLPDLVDVELAQRFGSQAEKFERARYADPVDHGELRVQTERMCNAWRALDAAAEAAGAPKIAADVWEVEDSKGRVWAIVRDKDTWPAASKAARIVTLAEIGVLLGDEIGDKLNYVKQVFGDVGAAETKRVTRLNEDIEDQIPF